MVQHLGLANQEQADNRMAVCHKCEHYKNNRCAKCGCFMFLKTRIKGMKCPIGLWGEL